MPGSPKIGALHGKEKSFSEEIEIVYHLRLLFREYLCLVAYHWICCVQKHLRRLVPAGVSPHRDGCYSIYNETGTLILKLCPYVISPANTPLAITVARSVLLFSRPTCCSPCYGLAKFPFGILDKCQTILLAPKVVRCDISDLSFSFEATMNM